MIIAIQVFSLFVGFFAFVQAFGEDRLPFRITAYSATILFVGITIFIEIYFKS